LQIPFSYHIDTFVTQHPICALVLKTHRSGLSAFS
jgi:hypothetical protein